LDIDLCRHRVQKASMAGWCVGGTGGPSGVLRACNGQFDRRTRVKTAAARGSANLKDK